MRTKRNAETIETVVAKITEADLEVWPYHTIETIMATAINNDNAGFIANIPAIGIDNAKAIVNCAIAQTENAIHKNEAETIAKLRNAEKNAEWLRVAELSTDLAKNADCVPTIAIADCIGLTPDTMRALYIGRNPHTPKNKRGKGAAHYKNPDDTESDKTGIVEVETDENGKTVAVILRNVNALCDLPDSLDPTPDGSDAVAYWSQRENGTIKLLKSEYANAHKRRFAIAACSAIGLKTLAEYSHKHGTGMIRNVETKIRNGMKNGKIEKRYADID